ncbi:MAG: ISL3 family transposase [Ktedonobacteraceae bacterium]|nr:ISL3 family transposase [Ktedonobacteraceae bacterium]
MRYPTSPSTPFLPLPDGIIIHRVTEAQSLLVVGIACTLPTACCPVCGHPSERIHGNYVRTVADLPCAGRRVVLEFTVRKFVCRVASCERNIFTERTPELVQPSARQTNRLAALVQAVGLVAGGEMGSRLAERMSIVLSPSTVLRRVMALPPPSSPPVRVLGVDDFAWKKRFRYGTILVDIERGKIIDVLLDRTGITFEKWLAFHPGIEVICRDRGSDYAKAATAAAPQALQVADRWHLVRNLAEALTPLLFRCQKELRSSDREQASSSASVVSPPNPLPPPHMWQQQPPAVVEQRHRVRQQARDGQYQRMVALREQGLTQAEIARTLGVGVRTVRSWLKAGTAPTWKRRFRRRSIFDPYAAYVLERWQQGVHDGKQLFEEIRAQGFKGSHGIVKRFLQTLRGKRGKRRSQKEPGPSVPTKYAAPNNPTWLFIRRDTDLTTQERVELFLFCEQSPTAKQTYRLVQAFLTMVREQRGWELEGWLMAVEMSNIPELLRFAYSLLRDRKAVEAGLSTPYSSGPVEAQVHKLKLVKRQMFGRAKLPLLRQRLLHAI